MFDLLDRQHRSLIRFSMSSQAITSELRRTDSYLTQLKKIASDLDKAIMESERHDPITLRSTKEGIKLLNFIITQTQFLKATSQAMDENLHDIRKSKGILDQTSGELVYWKRKENKLIKRIEKILTFH